MIRARIDRWFAHFRQHGDARLLARVFDHAAPELWRVAAHLCCDRHDAEDAVQSTFLAAIENKDAWDGERALLPWLVGLLVNRVREQRRARLRVVDGARLDVREVVDPATAAGERELGTAFAAALRDVSEPFRTVVEQHFVHGLGAAEIAAATGVPAATVRTRLHRGLEQLRQKLPAGAVAGSLVPLRMPTESLAAVREAVLAKVPGGAAVAVGSGAAALSWFGVVAMHKVLFGLAAACVGLAVWWVADPSLAQRAGTAGGVPAVAAVATTEGAASAANATVSTTNGNEPSAGERIEAPAFDAAGTLSVLVRNGATKAPLADVQVQLTHETRHVHSATGEHSLDAPVAMSAASEPDAPESADGRTDETGRVVLRIAAGRVRVWVGAGLPSPGDFVIVVPSTTTEHLCDVPPVFTADVLVVDAGGAPVRDAVILALGNQGREMREVGRTDAAGRWRDDRVDTQLLVRAVHDAYAASPAAVAPGQAGTLVLKLGGAVATIHGLVTDAVGAPVPSAVVVFVQDGWIGQSHQPLTVRTDANGRYRCAWLEAGGYHILVNDQRDPRDRRVVTATATASSGEGPATDLRFEAGATLGVRLRRHDGQPVVNHSVQLARRASEIPMAFAPWNQFGGMSDAEGMFTFRGLPPGHYLLTAHNYQATIHRELELRAGESVFEHTFGELCSLQVEVVDEHERPRADIRVMRKVNENEWTGLTTDAKGRVRFELLEKGEHTVALAASEKGLRRSLHTVSTERPARLVMPTEGTSGRVIGRVVMPRGELPKQIKLAMFRDVADNPFRSEAVDVAFDATSGAFQCADLPAGRYRFAAATMEPPAILAHRADIEVSATGVTDLGTIELGSGEILVDVRMAGGDPGKVHASVGLPGTDFFSGEPLQASATRPIRRQHLAAGAYRVMVWGENVLPAFADATVAIDQTTQLAVDVQPGVRTEVHLPGSIGMMTVHFPDGSVVREVVLELRSWVRGFAPGTYRVEYTDFSGERYTAEFPVTTASGDAIELRLAAR